MAANTPPSAETGKNLLVLSPINHLNGFQSVFKKANFAAVITSEEKEPRLFMDTFRLGDVRKKRLIYSQLLI